MCADAGAGGSLEGRGVRLYLLHLSGERLLPMNDAQRIAGSHCHSTNRVRGAASRLFPR